jgi:hypothetical protein
MLRGRSYINRSRAARRSLCVGPQQACGSYSSARQGGRLLEAAECPQSGELKRHPKSQKTQFSGILRRKIQFKYPQNTGQNRAGVILQRSAQSNKPSPDQREAATRTHGAPWRNVGTLQTHPHTPGLWVLFRGDHPGGHARPRVSRISAFSFLPVWCDVRNVATRASTAWGWAL